jgi:anhydro-N-acetylmuramic acid kinase
MNKQNYNVVGVMSGTSLDGIDLAHVKFIFTEGKWHFEILEAQTIPYEENWVERLKNGINLNENELKSLNNDYTKLLGTIINAFILEHKIENLDAVCSHGHTILHQPQNGFTLQIGNLPKIATYIKQKVVCDFRVQDVKLGGQGAPLVPIGDKLLFSEYDFCLNLGGFSNISFHENGKRIAFDISPVNTVLNHFANQLGFDYDDEGKLAKSGILNVNLFKELNQLPYYQLDYPKSLGFEFVKETVFTLISKYNDTPQNFLRTFTEHIAYQIANVLANKTGKLIVTGGGAFNSFLITKTQQLLPKIEIVVPDSKTINFKEALIFGLLGVLKLRNEVNILSTVTGASHDHCSGVIFD